MDPLQGRVALLTGASGGIGGALALALAVEGVDVALAYASHAEDAEAAAVRVRATGRRALLLSGDMADPAVPERLVRETVSELGSCDVLVANAGVGRQLAWEDVDLDAWNQAVDVNLHFIAARVAGNGITVNTIAPALVAGTRMLPGDPAAVAARLPVGRLGTTDEVADLALAMLRNGYITNKTFAVDGGVMPT